MAKKPKFEPLSDDGDHMTWEHFAEACKSGDFIDYDGFGDLATVDQVSNVHVSPSQLEENSKWKKPTWATHVVWYNR